MNVFDRLRRFLPRNAEPVKPDPMVRMGIVRIRGDLKLCEPEAEIPGYTVKIVTVPLFLIADEGFIRRQYGRMQLTLSSLPTSLRPRKRKPPASPPGA